MVTIMLMLQETRKGQHNLVPPPQSPSLVQTYRIFRKCPHIVIEIGWMVREGGNLRIPWVKRVDNAKYS